VVSARPLSALVVPALLASALLVPGPGHRLVGQEDGGDPSRPLVVYSAASLSTTLPAYGRAWSERRDLEVRYSFDSSSRAARQIAAGAPADLFISADRAWVDWLRAELGLESPGRSLLGNRLVLIAGSSGPERGGFEEAAAGGLGPLLLAGENVPAGRYSDAALSAMDAELGTSAGDRIRGGSVRTVVEGVASGAAPVGLVYATDVRARADLRVLDTVPASFHPPIEYVGLVLRPDAPDASVAEAFLGALPTSGVFTEAGFTPAPGIGGAPAARSGGAAVPPPPLPDPVSAVWLSVMVAVAATLAGLPLAVFLGWVLARKEFAGRTLLSTLVLVPLVLPPVVTGFLLLEVLSPRTPLGRLLDAAGLPIPFTILGAVLAALVVGMPLYVSAIRGAFASVDPHLEEMALTLGDRPRQAFWRVTLPLAAPGIAAGAILAFARALGEFGATVVLAGNMEGETRTIALAVYTLLEAPGGRQAIWTLVGASVLLSAGALLGYEILTRRQRARAEWVR
jgi:molybdate transport system permease protein